MAVPARRTESSSSARPVQRWDPFREFEQLQEEMGRLVQSVWPQAQANGGAWMPLADIEETEDAWIIEAELPGVDRKDVNVELRDGELVITGEIKEKERKGVVRRRTRRTGQFEYRVMLPARPTRIRSRRTSTMACCLFAWPSPKRRSLDGSRSRRRSLGASSGAHSVSTTSVTRRRPPAAGGAWLARRWFASSPFAISTRRWLSWSG